MVDEEVYITPFIPRTFWLLAGALEARGDDAFGRGVYNFCF